MGCYSMKKTNISFIVVIIYNVGSHNGHTTTVLMVTCHCISLLFILHKNPNDGLRNAKHVGYVCVEECKLCSAEILLFFSIPNTQQFILKLTTHRPLHRIPHHKNRTYISVRYNVYVVAAVSKIKKMCTKY